MSNLGIFAKIRSKGLRWLYKRMNRELRNPTYRSTKFLMNNYLRLKKTMSPKLQGQTDCLLAVYDLDANSLSFNFAEFLVDAEFESTKRGYWGFTVIIVPSANEKLLQWDEFESSIGEANKHWRIQNIIVPLTFHVRKCKGLHLLKDRGDVQALIDGKAVYPDLYDGTNIRSTCVNTLYRKLSSDAYYEGITATRQALEYIQNWRKTNYPTKKVITITLRNTSFDIPRNSNIDAWSKFSVYARREGYLPVVIPDTDDAFIEDSRFKDAVIFRECAWNIALRIALYEASYLNFFVPNGPCALAYLSKSTRYIVMNCLPEGSSVTTRDAYRNAGLSIGESYPFAKKMQKLCFLPDTYPNILSEFQTFLLESNEV